MIIIGHRGAAGYEPENTLISFRKALKLKVDMIELDVHICKSKELVVIHDKKVDRTTNSKGKIADLNLNELKKLDAGKGEKIPTLKEVLNFINKKTKINIELKGNRTAKPVNDIIEEYVKKGWRYKDFIVSSFNYKELKDFFNINQTVKLSVLIDKNSKDFFKIVKEIKAYSINPSLNIIDKNFIKSAHDKGLKVFVYTVNNEKDIKKMEKLEIEGIFSDYPDKI
jgi:glycerophosphoryl diester phosphodiesterase